MRWWIVLLLLPTATAAPLDAIAADDGLLLSRDFDDPRHDPEQEMADGTSSTTDRITWSLWWDGAAYLDGNATAVARIGSDTAIKDVSIMMTITSGNRTLATGADRATGLGIGYDTVSWSVPVEPGHVEGVWWNITATGRFSALFLDVGGNTTHLILPTTRPPPPPPVVEERNVTAPSLHVMRDLEGAYLDQQTRWLGAPGAVTVTWNGSLASGSLHAWLVAPDGATRWEARWPEAGVGRQNITTVAGDWSLHVAARNATGHYDIHLRQIVADPDPEPERQRSPMPWSAALAVLWMAAKRR